MVGCCTRCGHSPYHHLQEPASQAIPRFYFPGGRPVPSEVRAAVHAAMQRVVDHHPDGLPILALRTLLRDVYELPTYLAYPLFFKLVQPGESAVRPRALLEWCEAHNLLGVPMEQRVFTILRGDPDRDYLVHDDFRSMMNGILLNHPGLEFLQETPEFQERYGACWVGLHVCPKGMCTPSRMLVISHATNNHPPYSYAETVIHRIFYTLNRAGNGRLTLRELRRGDLLEALHALDEEEDINRVLKYFSYEHFYVIYCKVLLHGFMVEYCRRTALVGSVCCISVHCPTPYHTTVLGA